MKRLLTMFVATALLAGPAAATLRIVTLNGTLVSQIDQPGTDANLAVGSLFTLNATIDMNRAVLWGDYGFYVAPPESFTITSGPLTWIATDDILDGAPIYTWVLDYYLLDGTLLQLERFFGNPVIAFADGKVVGVAGDLSPADNSDRPRLQLGSYFTGDEYQYNEGPGEPLMLIGTYNAMLSSTFRVLTPDGLYGNIYDTPGFTGTWDFAGSSVQAIPEPNSWAMMIVGLGTVGALLRRRQRPARAPA